VSYITVHAEQLCVLQLYMLWTCVRSCQEAASSSVHVNIVSRNRLVLLCSQRPQHRASAGHTVSTTGTRARRRMPPRWLMLLLHVPALQGALSFCARYATSV
jgi:hypothetical protein